MKFRPELYNDPEERAEALDAFCRDEDAQAEERREIQRDNRKRVFMPEYMVDAEIVRGCSLVYETAEQARIAGVAVAATLPFCTFNRVISFVQE